MILSILQGKIISWQDGDTSVYVGCKEPLLDLCFFFPLHFTCSRSVSAKRVFWNKSGQNERREIWSPNFWLLTHNFDLNISLFIFHLPQQLQNICVLYLSEKKMEMFFTSFLHPQNFSTHPHSHIVEVKTLIVSGTPCKIMKSPGIDVLPKVNILPHQVLHAPHVAALHHSHGPGRAPQREQI